MPIKESQNKSDDEIVVKIDLEKPSYQIFDIRVISSSLMTVVILLSVIIQSL